MDIIVVGPKGKIGKLILKIAKVFLKDKVPGYYTVYDVLGL